MLNFTLFRIKLYKNSQSQLFSKNLDRAALLSEFFSSKPSFENKRHQVWHIGNVQRFSPNGMYFAFGKTAKSKFEIFVADLGEFVEEQIEVSPYTHVVLDLRYQLLAVAKKPKLAPTVYGIAHKLEALANSHEIIKNSGFTVEISDLKDPEDFIEQVKNAYAVTRFVMDFGAPNVWDVNKDFQKPMQDLIDASNASKGHTIVLGKDLNKNTLETLARAAAATGHNAKASIRSSGNRGRPKLKQLKGNPVTTEIEEKALTKDLIKFADRVRYLYEKIKID